MRKLISIKFQIPGTHNWPEAKYPVEFLKHEHRHLFHFDCRAPVDHNNRDLEFFMTSNKIQAWLVQKYWQPEMGVLEFGAMSCEAIGEELLNEFKFLQSVAVYEDGENGAVVVR